MDSVRLNQHKLPVCGLLVKTLGLLLALSPACLAAEESQGVMGGVETSVQVDKFDPVDGKCYAPYQCAPRWAARVGILALSREQPDSRTLFSNPNNPAENLNASAFDFGYAPGWDVSLMRRSELWPDVEFRYMGTDAWSASAGAVTNSADQLLINANPQVFVPTGRTIDAVYGSDLNSFELNMRSDSCGPLTWLLGIRHIKLEEAFHADLVDTVTPAPTVTYDTVTDSQLYGVQLGLEASLASPCERLELDLIAKAGIYHSVGSQRSAINTGVVVAPANGSAENAAMQAELHLMGNYRLINHLSVRGGYGIMALTNVVLATEQMNASNFNNATGIDNKGRLIYHGGFLGLEYAY